MGTGRNTAPLTERMRSAISKPPEPDEWSTDEAPEQVTADDLAYDVKYADDKERLIGLVAAPIAAAIGVLVMTALIDNDPLAMKGGVPNKLHVALSTYYDLTGVLLGLSVLMLVAALMRKRLFLGIAAALYGLSIFNLHFWGFGVPFILMAAWYLVRAYRLQRDLREANDMEAAAAARATRMHPNRRYTPAATSRRH